MDLPIKGGSVNYILRSQRSNFPNGAVFLSLKIVLTVTKM